MELTFRSREMGEYTFNFFEAFTAATLIYIAIAMTANQRYAITVEYYERGGNAVMQLRWRPPGASSHVAVPANRLYTP